MRYIGVNAPAWRGAPQPKFNRRLVNESRFEDELRCKEATIEFGKAEHIFKVFWLAQDSSCPTDKFNKEILRVFKTNGAPAGSTIDVEFGSRDEGICETYQLTVK